MKKVFNVYVMSLQAKPYKDRMHYTIKKWHCYYHVSRKLACYLMWCNGCAHITGWNNGKPLLSLNNDQLHGCFQYIKNFMYTLGCRTIRGFFDERKYYFYTRMEV